MPKSSGSKEWAKVFKCVRCGYCCHGQTTISLDMADQQRLKKYFRLDDEKLRERYLRVTGTVVQMQVTDGHCIFFLEKAGCTVHQARPWRCRQWPLHPSILKDKNNFEAIRESCPGISKKVSYEEFCRVLQGVVEQEQLSACAG